MWHKKIRIEIVDDEVALLALLLMGKKGTNYTKDLVSMSHSMSSDEIVEGMLEIIHNDLTSIFVRIQI